MVTLRILAEGASIQAQNNARGKLFEALMRQVLRKYQFNVDSTTISLAGMELDISGVDRTTNRPFYGECKCYSEPFSGKMFNEFVGKYTTRWTRDKKAVGLFIALPRLNPDAKGLYRDNFENHPDFSIGLWEEDQVLAEIVSSGAVVSSDSIVQSALKDYGRASSAELLYTEFGFIWVIQIVAPGSLFTSRFSLFNGDGQPLSNTDTIEYVKRILPDLADLEQVFLRKSTPKGVKEAEGTINIAAKTRVLAVSSQRIYKRLIREYLSEAHQIDPRSFDLKVIDVRLEGV